MTVTSEVELSPWDPAWATAFEVEQELLASALRPWLAGGVEHIGSTAIPGLSAKPILDLMAGVTSLSEAAEAADALAAQGYHRGVHRPREAHWFAKPVLEPWTARTHQLHLTEVGSSLWRERLAFRDALRESPELLSSYQALKLSLVTRDLRGYTDAKRAFVAEVLAGRGIAL